MIMFDSLMLVYSVQLWKYTSAAAKCGSNKKRQGTVKLLKVIYQCYIQQITGNKLEDIRYRQSPAGHIDSKIRHMTH